MREQELGGITRRKFFGWGARIAAGIVLSSFSCGCNPSSSPEKEESGDIDDLAYQLAEEVMKEEQRKDLMKKLERMGIKRGKEKWWQLELLTSETEIPPETFIFLRENEELLRPEIYSLRITGENLRSLPPEIGDLTIFKELFLKGSAEHLELPSQIGKLPLEKLEVRGGVETIPPLNGRLKRFVVDSNILRDLNLREVFPEEFPPPSLSFLYVKGEQLEATKLLEALKRGRWRKLASLVIDGGRHIV